MEITFLLSFYYFKNYTSLADSVLKLNSETDPLGSVNGYWDMGMQKLSYFPFAFLLL